MKIFLSQSEDASRRIAEHFRSWLPKVLPFAQPWMAERDLEPGTRWSAELECNLCAAATGIICVAPENMRSQWLLFEAGVLSRSLPTDNGKQRLFPLLYEVSRGDLSPGPLAQFQAVELRGDNEAGMRALVQSLNACAADGVRLPSQVVDVMFDRFWPDLKREVFGEGTLEYSSEDTLRFFEVDLHHFLRSIDASSVEALEITAHTGESLVKGLVSSLSEDTKQAKKLREVLIDKAIPVRILCRDLESETSARRAGIERTKLRLEEARRRGFNILYRTYQHLPVFSSVIACHETSTIAARDSGDLSGRDAPRVCEASHPRAERTGDRNLGQPDAPAGDHGLARRQGLISYYHFPSGQPSQRATKGFVVDEGPGESNMMADIVGSWFAHMWGKSDRRRLHTIVFDFDDTIVESHSYQVQAWVDTVKEAIGSVGLRSEQLRLTPDDGVANEDGLSIADERVLRARISRIFFEKGSARAIFDALFAGVPERVAEALHSFRYRRREELTAQAHAFEGAPDALRELFKEYNLSIISATDEELIKDYLSDQRRMQGQSLCTVFRYIFGKREATFNWRNVDRKSQLLRKVEDIMGVPACRMVYVGDQAGDYAAARALGFPFIEARLIGEVLTETIGHDSLLAPKSQPTGAEAPPPYFTRWSDLKGCLEQLENDLAREAPAAGDPTP